MPNSLTLSDLSSASGIPARTIRFYIARGLLPGPIKAGRAAVYTADHLVRLEAIKALQTSGRMLSEIAHDLSPGPTAAKTPAPSPWWQFAIQDDVTVWVRSEISPWRMKQIRAAIDELAARLREPDDDHNETINEKEKSR